MLRDNKAHWCYYVLFKVLFVVPNKTRQSSDRNTQNSSNTVKWDQFWADTINNFEPVSTWWANYLKDCLQIFTPFQNQSKSPAL